MAIPVGTTSRQVGAVARWAIMGTLCAGMLSLWWPDYASWGGLIAAIAVVLAVWLWQKTVAGERWVLGQPFYAALAGPAAALTYHLVVDGLGMTAKVNYAVGGAIDMSVLFHIAVLAVGVFLVQNVLTGSSRPALWAAAGAAAMVGGAIVGHSCAGGGGIGSSMTLAGMAGACALGAAGLFGVGDGRTDAPGRRREFGAICVAAGIAGGGAMAFLSPVVALYSAATAAACVGVAAVSRRKWWAGAMLLFTLAAGGAAMMFLVWGRPVLAGWKQELIGRGEFAFVDVHAAAGGLAVLVTMAGWGGTIWAAVVAALALGRMAGGAGGCGRGRADTVRAGLWMAAVVLSTCAMLAPGGLFPPTTTISVMFTWGLAPAMMGWRAARRPGVLLAGAYVVLLVLLGLALNDGLPAWAVLSYGGTDSFMHLMSGYLLASLLAWQLGCRRLPPGLAGITLAVAAAAGGEWLQGMASRRSVQFKDWIWGTVGALAAGVVYMLCVGAKCCESPDARQFDGEMPD